MKKVYLLSFVFLFLVLESTGLFSQGLTMPDHSYGEIDAFWGFANHEGVATPGPYGFYSNKTQEQSSGVFLGHGYRWWGYPGAILLICNDFPKLDYPGMHGAWDMSSLSCSGYGYNGYTASWGAVVVDPASRKIHSTGIVMNHNSGPTYQYCIPNPFGSGFICYPTPSTWGYIHTYGYLRKMMEVKSTTLNDGDPVDINVSLTSTGVLAGDGTKVSNGVLFLNKTKHTIWRDSGWGMDYLNWGAVRDILGTTEFLQSMLGYLNININTSNSIAANVAVGDTVVIDMAFYNSVELNNPGTRSASDEDAEGSIGEDEYYMVGNIDYLKTGNMKNHVIEDGNNLTYDITCNTSEAYLVSVNSEGPHVDEDADGLCDEKEMGPNGDDDTYDGNADGLPDYVQSNVASFHSFDMSNYVTLEVPQGINLSEVVVTSNPSPDDVPEDAEFPFGFFDFSIDGLDPGDAVTVTLYLHGGETIDTYYKYGLTPDNIEMHWYEFLYDGTTGADINGDVITLHFRDGLRGDDDITANGSIKEPGGPLKSTSTNVNDINGETVMMHQNFPNPFVEKTTIGFQLGHPSKVTLKVYNVLGELVKVLANQQMPQGTFEVDWNGTNYAGHRVSPGVYLYRLETVSVEGENWIVKKMMMQP